MHDHRGGGSHMPDGPRERLQERLASSNRVDHIAVEKVVRAVFSTMHGDLNAQETSLLAQVEELGRTITAAKAEIAALRVGEISYNHIPSATDELDAIVAHTASATNCILEVCETLDAVASKMTGLPAEQLGDATTKIYEACSFQDITGQRINKVVLTLKAIDEKVAHILATFSISSAEALSPGDVTMGDDRALLNGPQLPMAAMDQAEIDRLMADF